MSPLRKVKIKSYQHFYDFTFSCCTGTCAQAHDPVAAHNKNKCRFMKLFIRC